MFIRFFLYLGIAGLCTCTGFLAILAIALFRFRRPVPASSVSFIDLPPVTLLKPLCGLEPNLRENLASFFDQQYPSFEIIFGMRDDTDPALQVLRSVQRDFPAVPVKVVFSGNPQWPNAKVWSLEKMCAQARHPYLVISDSDVRVDRNYIEEVVRPLLNPATGLVTCLYLLEGMTFALGPTMAIRADVLDAIGGMAVLGDYCADDYVLGNLVYNAGWKVELSRHAIDHVVLNRSFKSSILHQVRWMKSARFSRPLGHIASVLSFGMPFALLAAAAAATLHHPLLALVLLACGLLNRSLLAVLAGGVAVGDRNAIRYFWLFPLRDLMGFSFWALSFFGNTVLWRNRVYELHAGGKMIPVRSPVETDVDADSTPVAVDHLA